MTKFLNISTDNTLGGNNSSDEVVSSQKALKHYIDSHSGGGGSVTTDNISINTNANDELQTIGVIDNNNSSVALKTWTGSFAEYTSIVTKDNDTIYIVTDENPVGLGAADVALSNLNSTGQAIIDGKVNKTGDTMSGDLVINKTTPLYILKNTSLDKTSTTAPSNDIISAFQVQDKDGQYVSNVFTIYNTSNNLITGLSQERTINSVNKQSFFNINIAADGADFVDASTGVKQSITNWAFPSTYIQNEIVIGASGFTYTAPADGFINLQISTNGNDGYIGVNYGAIQYLSFQDTGYGNPSILAPVAKGQIVTITYGSSSGSTSVWIWQKHHFIYAIGN